MDGVVQSISPEDGLTASGYWGAMVPDDRPHRALILGLGGGTLARLLQVRWAGVAMIGIDDDAAIVETAAAVGWLPRAGLEVVMSDAFEYVQSCTEHFDFIAVDLFRGERLAARAFGKPFLRHIRGLLEPRGRVALNLFADRRLAERRARIAVFFEIYKLTRVGGNEIIHARRRRA